MNIRRKILFTVLLPLLLLPALSVSAQQKKDTVSTSGAASPAFQESGSVACSCGDCCGDCHDMAAYTIYGQDWRDAREARQEDGFTGKEKPAVAEKPETGCGYRFALRANLLRWATLTPDLGIEWRVNGSVGIVLDGSYTSWSWKNGDRRYALWEVNPEVRWYLGQKKNCYVGAMYKAGAFNYKLSDSGKQGNLMGGGVTGGYRLRVNDVISFDFSLGLGYVRAGYDSYSLIDGVRVKSGSCAKNWWGPTQAGVTLVWTIF